MPPDDTDGVNWKPLLQRMSLYAASQLPRRRWRSEKNGHPPGAEEVRDLVQDAVECALRRKSEWKTADGPNLIELQRILKGRICHRIAGLSELQENKNVALEPLLFKNPNAWEFSTEAASTSRYGVDPGKPLFAELEVHQKLVRERAIRALDADIEAQAVFVQMLLGTFKPEDLAEDLKIDTKDANNRKKRVFRKLGVEFEDMKDLYGLSPSTAVKKRETNGKE